MTPYYSDALVTLYHGDCAEVAADIPKVGLMVTDPPYALGSQRSEWSATAGVAIGLRECVKRVDKRGAALVMTTSSGRGIEFTQGAMGTRLPFNRVLVWHKQGTGSRAAGPWRWDVALVLAFGRATFGKESTDSSVYANDGYNHGEIVATGHPSTLPVALARWMVRPWVEERPTLLDPFAGSGSILVAAKVYGIPAIGIEIEEKHCETIARRLSAKAPVESDQRSELFR